MSAHLPFSRLRIDADDLRPLVPIVQLNKVENGSATPIFCVHSIEGVGIPLMTLAEKLQVPVYCFQCTEETPLDSVKAIANCYIQRMKKIQPKGPYRILGYSYGATIAFNIATQLQAQELPETVEHLILLDGSHKYTRTYRNAYRIAYGFAAGDLSSDPRFESELLCAFAIRFASDTDYRALRNELMRQPSWEDRVQCVQDKVMSGGMFSNISTIVFAVNSLRQKFIIADRYIPEQKFQGDVVLIRAKHGAAIVEGIGSDYGLHEVLTIVLLSISHSLT
ncbi:unnamed protein product [Soboliphyme baturini]|uniref:oleoyl-[acyl-carrier-protein] hydrolase n=1 Tax=Soboliphyme baturini TaxID=241478 RepID=A0A183IXN0_9BILA|nr:unnamed protein product [Soboliphyme baturini]